MPLAIADYTDTSAFAPEVDDNGIAQPEEWFGLNPADGEDSAEEIDSSDEGEEEEEGEDAVPDGGAAGSLSLTVPLATRRVRAHRLQPAMIKPRLASRRCCLHRPARLPCCALSLICRLYFPVLLLFEQYFVKLA